MPRPTRDTDEPQRRRMRGQAEREESEESGNDTRRPYQDDPDDEN